MNWVLYLPTLNACLNACAAILLVLGFVNIKRGNKETHRRYMLSAFGMSVLFLTSYVIYHLNVLSVPFTHPGPVRYVYFTILITHIILAAAVPFLAVGSLFLASKMKFETHKKLSRWTFPIWMYVSVTGVLVYLMLYHLFPSSALPTLAS